MTRIEIDDGCYVDISVNEEDEFCIAFDQNDSEHVTRWVMPLNKDQTKVLIGKAMEYLGLADDHK